MKGVEIYNGFWTVEDVKNSSDKIFVFGDNNARVGKGGQAIIRDLRNSIGIRTKKGPNNKPVAFYNDNEYHENCKNILQDVVKIRSKLVLGQTIVLAKDGYGTGLAKLSETAPMTYNFLVDVLRDFFEFDNNTGKVWKKTPSIDQVNSATYLDFSKSNKDLLLPTNNSKFKSEYLEKNLMTYFDLIKFEKKVSFTSKNLYKKDTYLILKFDNKKDYLLVKTCCESYVTSLIDSSTWNDCEGISETLSIDGFFQTQIKYIGQVDTTGQILFKNDLFSTDISPDKVGRTVGVPILTKTEEVNSYNKKKKPFYQVFRKSLEELLEEKKLNGEIKKMPDYVRNDIQLKGDRYQVKVDNDYYAIIFHKHLFTNSIEVLTVSKTPFI